MNAMEEPRTRKMNTAYRVLLLDIDDTLLDWKATERAALQAIFPVYGVPCDVHSTAVFKETNRKLWAEHEAGRLSREELFDSRFHIVFKQLGKDVDGREAETLYRESLNRGAYMIEGADTVCRALAERYTLCAVSNGSYITQIQRLALSGLNTFFRDLFISEKIGSPKPSRAFFEHVFASLPEIPLQAMLIIGDSLEADMRGGYDAGIDTCWFNPDGTPNTLNIPITHTVRKLSDLTSLLLPPGCRCSLPSAP